ncbi:glycoside hydrolase family 97 protein [Carboxylicivirga mesophila]|uniref:Glycoside hydrolase family 97 protein n=1 Tax=Carboxylicivirga mesophila TaxID=1166478 RepID=A0ABS5K6R6_9BACT|nr:glycoside hydrolase family 97 protein [Carboxylicivirga mesophila]MBS2210684.1 glycoside hydrolase family 97 protein [Carboxylicivirga mesophila]
MNLKNITLLLVFISTVITNSNAKENQVSSPDQNIKVTISIGEEIAYSVDYKGQKLIAPSAISMDLGFGDVLGHRPELMGSKTTTVNEVLKPVVKEKRSEVKNHYNELILSFRGDYQLAFRVFDDGMAYRWISKRKGDITVYNEEANFTFATNQMVYFPETKGFITAFQHTYKYLPLDSISSNRMCITPALVDVEKGPKVAITEADLRDYPGMFLTGNSNNTLKGKYAPYILKGDRLVKKEDIKRADYLARTTGTRSFPWRVVTIVDNDGDLLNTEIVYRLGAPSKIKDPSWIKSGKIAWDWYNANNIYNVDFRAGLNYDTYKYYIDFAADNGIEYVVLDEGWSNTYDIWELNEDMRMDDLTAYALEKEVGLILWVEWSTFDADMEALTDKFVEWGVVGIKMDFMNRDDQYMVRLYERVAETCARKQLMVDFHGAFKPTGIRRTYPNIMTYEGVAGLENCKWADYSDPEYDVTFPFIRMLAGPADYTPGAMNTAQKKNFKPIFNRPMGLGTRAHQLAMYVVFESPLQMLADSPTAYMKETECLAFLSEVPVEWDETVVLDAEVGEYIVIARKHGNDWYLAAMTDWTKRDVTIDLSELSTGTFTLEEYADGVNADRNGNDYKKTIRTISSDETIEVKMAPGGGWAAILRGSEN